MFVRWIQEDGVKIHIYFCLHMIRLQVITEVNLRITYTQTMYQC